MFFQTEYDFTHLYSSTNVCKKKGNVFPLQPGVAQRVGRGIALLFYDRGTRRG